MIKSTEPRARSGHPVPGTAGPRQHMRAGHNFANAKTKQSSEEYSALTKD